MSTLFCYCVVPEIKTSIPLHGRLFDLHPPPPRRIFRSRGFLMAPLPPGISRILKRGLHLPTLGTRGFSLVRRKFSVSATSATSATCVDTSSARVSLILEIQSRFGT